MIEQLFAVATEFKFDIGQALLNTNALKGAVDDLSQASNSALGSLGYLSGALVTRLGFGSGGLLTVLSKAVSLSEDFDQASLNFSNTISTNMRSLTGTIDTFNDRLLTSQVILADISNVANAFAIPTSQLAHMTQMIATPLAQHGKLGHNFGGAIEMSKNLIMGSQMAGINPQAASESLYRSLTDGMPLHGALFSRLVNTSAFKDAHISNQHQMSQLNPSVKIDLLAKALRSLTQDTEAATHRLDSVTAQFTILKNMFMDLGSILRPIGDAFRRPLIQILKGINSFLTAHAKEMGDQIGKLFANVLADPKALLINLMQLRDLGKDFKRSLHFVELLGTFRFIKFVLGVIGIQFNGGLLKRALLGLWEGLSFLVGLVPWARILSGAFTLLRVALLEVAAPFAAFLFMFQILSRAKAIAKVNDVKAWIELTPRVSAVMLRLKTAFENIMLPINMAIDFWAKLLAILFETSFWGELLVSFLETFAGVLEFLGTAMVGTMALFSGFAYMLIGFVDDIANLRNPFTKALDNYKVGLDDYLKDNAGRLGGDKNKVTTNYVNNFGNVTIKNDFKEQQEPDRIAFTIKEQILKAAKNPTTGRNTGLASPFAGAHN